jgi:phosphoribosyl 1,2-cyclic phosphate phosphodiesterase
MRVRFLGTSAGELYPGLWCRCRNCQAARAHGGKDRRQSAALYLEAGQDATSAETITRALVDFPSEIADQALRYNVDLTLLEHLLVTHSHGDHWFPYLLRWRHRPWRIFFDPPTHRGAPRFTELPTLHVYGNAAVEAILRRELGDDLAAYDLEFHRVSAGQRFRAGALEVTPLCANHDVGREEAVHYLIQDKTATLLYGLDGDTFLPETREVLRQFHFDLVIMESTYGQGEGGNHRNFARLEAEAEWFRAENLLRPEGQLVATHFSPHHCPPHAETSAYLAERAILAAWDGLELTPGAHSAEPRP